MSDPKKYNKCPYCKGTTGFKINIWLGGYQEEKRKFDGSIIDINREGIDEVDNTVTCLDCGKYFPTENVRINK